MFLATRLQVPASAFVAPNAVLLGQVILGEEASVWFGAVVRGDLSPIVIGNQSNVQDACVLHVTRHHPVTIGERVTVGHGAIVHGATIEDDVLVGIRATVMNGATVGRGSLIGAGALVPEGVHVPPRSLVLGVPGRVVKPTSDEQVQMILEHAANYVAYAKHYMAQRR